MYMGSVSILLIIYKSVGMYCTIVYTETELHINIALGVAIPVTADVPSTTT